jgi:hypothetical protein
MTDLLHDGNPQYLPTALLDKSKQMTFPFQRAASTMAAKIRQYRRHRWFGYAHLTQRIGSLKDIKRALLQMGRESCLNKSEWTGLKDQVNAEFYFLEKLQRHQKQRDPQFDDLFDALEKSLEKGASARKVKTIRGGRVHSSLRGTYILERIDPLHRGRNPMIVQGFYMNFKSWLEGKSGRVPSGIADADPWDQIMAYFLLKHDQDPSKTEVQPTYHGKKQRVFDSLEFDGKVLSVQNGGSGGTTKKKFSKALAYYAFSTADNGQTKYEKYRFSQHGKTTFPYQAPFHTVSKQRRGSHASGKQWTGSVLYPQNAQKARGFSETDAQLCWASLYVLVEDIFYVTPPDDFHSWAAGGSGVAGAGLIAADNGKIVAIDNSSGHYAPDWRQLRQAVQLIANSGAFSSNAVVGLTYRYITPTAGVEAFNAAVLRWMDFLRICHVIRDKQRRMQVWDSITSRYQPLPIMAEGCHGTLDVHARVWNKYNFTWNKVGTDLFNYLDSP